MNTRFDIPEIDSIAGNRGTQISPVQVHVAFQPSGYGHDAEILGRWRWRRRGCLFRHYFGKLNYPGRHGAGSDDFSLLQKKVEAGPGLVAGSSETAEYGLGGRYAFPYIAEERHRIQVRQGVYFQSANHFENKLGSVR